MTTDGPTASQPMSVSIYEGTRVFLHAGNYEFEVVNQWSTASGANHLADLLRREVVGAFPSITQPTDKAAGQEASSDA